MPQFDGLVFSKSLAFNRCWLVLYDYYMEKKVAINQSTFYSANIPSEVKFSGVAAAMAHQVCCCL